MRNVTTAGELRRSPAITGSSVQVRRGNFKQQAGSGSPPVGELVVKSSAVVLRSQPGLAAALAESTALSRAISGTPVPEGDTGSAPSNQSPRQSRLLLDAAAASDPRRVFTVTDTARMLSISRSTVYNLIKSNSLKTIKLGSRRLITRDFIEDLLAAAQ